MVWVMPFPKPISSMPNSEFISNLKISLQTFLAHHKVCVCVFMCARACIHERTILLLPQTSGEVLGMR